MSSELIAMLHEVLPDAVVAFIIIATAISVIMYKLQDSQRDILRFIKSIKFVLALFLSVFIWLIFLYFKCSLLKAPTPPSTPVPETFQIETPTSPPITTTTAPLPTTVPFATDQFISYGNYPQSNDFPSSISWIIMSTKDNQLLLISQYVLDAHYFGMTNQWQHSELRDWLNSTFLNKAFTAEEQLALSRNSLNNLATIPTVADTDMLSIKTTQSTQYAKNMGALPSSGNSSYITQTPKGDELIYYIGPDGKVVQMFPGSICGVRPIVMIDISKICTTGGSGTSNEPWIIQPTVKP